MDWRAHWGGRERFVVFDARPVDGAGFDAALKAWHADPRRPGRLHYIALARGSPSGFRRRLQADSNVTLDLLCVPLAQALAQLEARIDAAVVHGVADSAAARAIARLAAPGARLFASDSLQEVFSAAGFVCEGDGGAFKGVFAGRAPQAGAQLQSPRNAIVLGAGLAGAAACERLCARGWQVTLVERHAHAATEASGNLAGIYMPLLSKDDNVGTRLSRAAFLFALGYWERLGGIGAAIEGAGCGVLQLARGPEHAGVQRAIAGQGRLPLDFAEWLDAPAASAMLGSNAPDGGWLFRKGGWAHPASVCAAMLAACGAKLTQRFGVGDVTLRREADGRWTALAADGTAIASAPTLILANGTGAVSLAQAATLPLTPVRGQVTHLAEGSVRALPFVLCGEAYLTPAAHGIHCAGASYDADPDPELRTASQDQNLARIRALLGDARAGFGAPLRGRVGQRCVAPDRLPLVGALPDPARRGRVERLRDVARHDGLHALLGYASRGLTWAPLCAELLAARLDGEPLPLETALAGALDPARFLLRERRRAGAGGQNGAGSGV
ncbi:FAD-dependent 5-carboxymethylaminomethyl-2-thiouridine(34) oxidoreductase MnmC [Massilia glaciei]|uniref:FAD-dependent oxidoreductase n=1 Tax=Massilia glaciei TaxID=1524097 RepID=A0A2U2HIF1_9BURK|nr:FAD-dependent 5-carboxymethylaminomethyl-2-thiouridine(34) oxidoreductase MnmC [Massilia glaciei]PWF46107.1 FAD-dependent oxidoreductase [Massilia glaciei]